MKSTGIVRRVDNMGRLVLPKELRNTLRINIGDSLEIFTEDDCVIVRKYTPGCVFCGSLENLSSIAGKFVCKDCAKKALE